MRVAIALALIAPIAACANIGALDQLNFTNRDAAWPTTRATEQPLPPVANPSRRHLSSMEVVDLSNGAVRRLSVSTFGNGFRVRESDGCVWTRDADWFSPSDSWANCGTSKNWRTAQASVKRDASIYPLQIGSTGAYTRVATTPSGERSTRQTRCQVTGAETVERPGGTATPAYVVVCDDGRIRRTTWFSPSEGPVAYREEHRRRGLRDAWVKKS